MGPENVFYFHFLLKYPDDNTLMAEREEEPKSLLKRVKEGSEKAGLKLNIPKTLRSWHLAPSLHGKKNRKKAEAVRDFIFLGSKITVDGECSLEIKRYLLLGRKAMTSGQCITETSLFQQRSI